MLPRAMALLSLLLVLVGHCLWLLLLPRLLGPAAAVAVAAAAFATVIATGRFLSQQPMPLRFIHDALDKAAAGAAGAALSPPTAPFGSASWSCVMANQQYSRAI